MANTNSGSEKGASKANTNVKANGNKPKTVKKKAVRLSKLAQCIRKTANTVKLPRALMPDSDKFDKAEIKPDMSAKFTQLIKKIKELDDADQRDHRKKFKHFIFTDIRESAYGAKAVASFLIAAGFELRMGHKNKMIKRDGEMVPTKAGQTIYKPAAEANNNGFAVLQSLPLWKNPLSVETKKKILGVFNSRPENVNGELLRIIVLDSKFKEGIDLYDVKYVHLLEPSIATSDLKQAVGRATRYCGQKGLPFVPRAGWKLDVFIYNTMLPRGEPFLLKDNAGNAKEVVAHTLMLEKSGLDLALMNLTQEITILAIQSAVDYELNYNINNFKIEQALLDEVAGEENKEDVFLKPSANASDVSEFKKYRWSKPVVQSGCEMAMEKGKAASFTKTQDFMRNYFTPERSIKGMLAWHSVGTGKTCMAVATATTKFEQAGYKILWVTRNALMADVYKNIFGVVCSIPLMKDGVVIPEDPKKQKRMLSKAWMNPISYRTFQNALEKKNELGRTLYKNNPTDPLYKTFLVIDEIHKLHDGDLSAAEAADFHTIQNYIFESYEKSGKNSVRPLLMTATPITDSPKELFEIINTLIPEPENRFVDLDTFRTKYTDANGTISDDGKDYYKERADGIVSYLNREFDPTTFTQPKFHTVSVPLQITGGPDIPSFIDSYMKQIGIDNLISETILERDCDADLLAAQKVIDDQITEVQIAIKETKDKEMKKLHKSRILDLKQLIKDEAIKHKTKKAKCLITNKEIAKAEFKTRKSFMTALIRDMKDKYDTAAKEGGSGQLKEIDKCFQFKRPVANDFMKIANEMFSLKKK
jgi:hypothetical protein